MSFLWTDAAVDQAKALSQQGRSGREIASILGTTKNSVISKLSRLGYPLSQIKTQKQPKRQRRSRKEAGEKANITRRVNRKIEELQRLSAELKRADAPAIRPSTAPSEREANGGHSHAVALLDLQPQHCRWPLWQTGEAPGLYCGAKREPACSYCAEHKFIARNGSPPTGKRFVMRRQKAAA